MIYVIVQDEGGFREFWIPEEHHMNLIAALGLLGNTMTVANAMELIK